VSSDLGRGLGVEVLEEVGEVVDREGSRVDLCRKGFEEPVTSARHNTRLGILYYLSVKLRISMGSSSNVSTAASCAEASSSSSFFTNTSLSGASSSSRTMFVLRGSSMSDTWGGPWSVLARFRDMGLFGVESRRVKEREGCRFLGRADMVATTAAWRSGR
jgi:hypothetical protein